MGGGGRVDAFWPGIFVATSNYFVHHLKRYGDDDFIVGK